MTRRAWANHLRKYKIESVSFSFHQFIVVICLNFVATLEEYIQILPKNLSKQQRPRQAKEEETEIEGT